MTNAQINRVTTRFPGLRNHVDPDLVGAKFASLARSAEDVPVPPAFVVPVPEFRAALGADSLRRIQGLMDELRATVGAFFVDTVARIAETAQPRIGEQTRRRLADRLTDLFGPSEDRRFAVRSSGVAEDGAGASFAGVYQSILDVRGADAVADAVEQCWRSYYAAPAVAARIRAGDFDAAPAMAVIVQEFVDPELAGVAFTGLDGDDGEILIEYVSGTAEGLVAGTRAAAGASSRRLAEVPAPHRETIGQVVRLTRRLAERRGHDLDVEWAADHRGVHVVQVRPVTARRTPGGAPGDEFWARRLYFEEPPADFPLGDVARVYTSFETKRGRANRLAAECGVGITTGWVFGFTRRALHDPTAGDRFSAVLRAGPAEECLVDLGDSLRQLVVPKAEVADRVRELAGADRDAAAPDAVVVRDYLRGRLGLVSRRAGDRVVVEYTPDGLLALNRGMAGGKVLVAGLDGSLRSSDESAAPLLPHLPRLIAFSDRMRELYGDVALEWVLTDDDLVFLDYSLLGADHPPAGHSGVVLSPGSASGPVLNVYDDELLRRLSIGSAVSVTGSAEIEHAEFAALANRVAGCAEQPIIRAPLPYAALSVLIGSVAGFVFDQGSVLSHLAILLREAGVPAVRANGAGASPDGVLGTITLGTFGTAGRALPPSPGE